MKQFTTILCFGLLALASAKPNYNYQLPTGQQQQFRPAVAVTNVRPQQQTTTSGIYSVVQAPPLAQFNQPAQTVQQQQNYGTQTTTTVQQTATAAQPQQQTFVTAPQLTQTVSVQEQQRTVVQQQPQVQQFVQTQPIAQQQYTQQQQYVQQQQQPIVQQVTVPQQQHQVTFQTQPQQVVTHQTVTQPQQVVTHQTVTQPQQVITHQTVTQPQQVVTQHTIAQPQQVVTQPQQTIITKDIFIHSAPEETEEVLLGKQLENTAPIRKNYRIVFIKAPSQNLKLTSAALKQVQAANEEKTVIYVLSKKPDVTEIQQQLTLTQAEPKVHKPEVYFIKYKTTEEAQRAQQEIQAQYDALGGSTHVSDEGIAPVGHISGGQLNLGSGFPAQTQTQTQTTTQYNTQQQQVQHTTTAQRQVQQQVQQPQQQTQTYVQQNFGSRSSGSTINIDGAPSTKYLPTKTRK